MFDFTGSSVKRLSGFSINETRRFARGDSDAGRRWKEHYLPEGGRRSQRLTVSETDGATGCTAGSERTLHTARAADSQYLPGG